MNRAASLALVLSTLACANHIRDVEFESKNLNAEVKELHYEVEAVPEVIETPKVELRYVKEELIESRIDLTLTLVEEYTPYAVVYELYEVPLGALSVPLSLGLNVLGVLLPGVVSRSLVNDYTDWSFAAANPFLNVQSEARFERRELSSKTRTAESTQNLVQNPLANWPVLIRYDDHRPIRVNTDAEGRVAFHVLELRTSSLETPPRKINASVGSDKTPGAPLHVELFIDRELGRRVFEASKLIPDINNAVVSSTRLSRAVYALDQIGFKAYSLRLEDRIYQRFEGNPKFVDRFREVLDKLYKGELQTGPPTWPVVIPPDEGDPIAPPLSN